MTRWLWSDNAIQAHFVCLMLIANSVFEWVEGGNIWPNKDCQTVLVVALIAYPVLLFLVYLQCRFDNLRS